MYGANQIRSGYKTMRPELHTWHYLIDDAFSIDTDISILRVWSYYRIERYPFQYVPKKHHQSGGVTCTASGAIPLYPKSMFCTLYNGSICSLVCTCSHHIHSMVDWESWVKGYHSIFHISYLRIIWLTGSLKTQFWNLIFHLILT